MNLNNHFGAALKKYLEVHGMNKSWLARELKVSPQAITALFNSESPRNHTKESVLEVLKVTEKQLLENEKRDESELERKYKEMEVKLALANQELLEYKRKEIKELQ